MNPRFDPVKSYNFLITFIDAAGTPPGRASLAAAAAGGFSEASGLEMSLELEEYKEGGRNDTVRRFPTRVDYGHLRFKRGVALSEDLWDWHFGFVEGRGQRRDGLVSLLDDVRRPVRVWQFRRGLPVKWTGPSLNAAQSEAAVEELEIAHEGLTLVSSRTLLGLGDAVALGRDLASRTTEAFRGLGG